MEKILINEVVHIAVAMGATLDSSLYTAGEVVLFGFLPVLKFPERCKAIIYLVASEEFATIPIHSLRFTSLHSSQNYVEDRLDKFSMWISEMQTHGSNKFRMQTDVHQLKKSQRKRTSKTAAIDQIHKLSPSSRKKVKILQRQPADEQFVVRSRTHSGSDGFQKTKEFKELVSALRDVSKVQQKILTRLDAVERALQVQEPHQRPAKRPQKVKNEEGIEEIVGKAVDQALQRQPPSLIPCLQVQQYNPILSAPAQTMIPHQYLAPQFYQMQPVPSVPPGMFVYK